MRWDLTFRNGTEERAYFVLYLKDFYATGEVPGTLKEALLVDSVKSPLARFAAVLLIAGLLVWGVLGEFEAGMCLCAYAAYEGGVLPALRWASSLHSTWLHITVRSSGCAFMVVAFTGCTLFLSNIQHQLTALVFLMSTMGNWLSSAGPGQCFQTTHRYSRWVTRLLDKRFEFNLAESVAC